MIFLLPPRGDALAYVLALLALAFVLALVVFFRQRRQWTP
jgi:hypothetical protein